MIQAHEGKQFGHSNIGGKSRDLVMAMAPITRERACFYQVSFALEIKQPKSLFQVQWC